MFKDFPNLHPLVVHFPIVLILIGAALQAVLVFKDWPPVRWITLVVMAGGFAGALAASTVFHAMPMGLSPQVSEVFSAHEQYASYALWLSGITLLLGGVGEFFQLRRRAFDILVLVSALAAAGAVSVAGHHGAQLVYIAGVGPQGHLVMKGHHHEHGGAGAMPGMDMGTTHDDDHAAGDQHEEVGPSDHADDRAAPDAASQPPASDMADMPGMGSPNKSARPVKTEAPMPAMSGMDMSAPKNGPRQPQASTKGGMADMPGMKTPSSKKQPPMPKGMDMDGPGKQPAMGAMPGMKGMDMKPASKKKPSKAAPGMSDMGSMPDMPGMAMPSGAKPKTNAPPTGDMKNMPGMEKGQAMPGMDKMPGMSMPNPMDKYRFEDNNPAREQPKKDH